MPKLLGRPHKAHRHAELQFAALGFLTRTAQFGHLCEHQRQRLLDPPVRLLLDPTLAVSGQRDEDIDYSDIPPVREIPADAVRGRFYRGHTIYLTDELYAYLCNIAMRRGVPLNDLVNHVLSQEVALAEALK